MAKQRDDKNQPKDFDDDEPLEAVEAEEVVEAEPKEKKPEPPRRPQTRVEPPRRRSQPTQLAPREEDDELLESAEVVEETKPVTPVPKLSIDEPSEAEEVMEAEALEVGSDVLSNEPPSKKKKTGDSSVVEAEVLDSDVLGSDVLEASPASDVAKSKPSSDVVRAEDVLADDLEMTGSSATGSSASGSKSGSGKSKGKSSDDLFAADFLEMQKEPTESSSSIFGSEKTADVPSSMKLTESLARKDEALGEILDIASGGQEEEKPDSESSLDLGSMPEIPTPTESAPPKIKKPVDRQAKTSPDFDQTIAFDEAGRKREEADDLLTAEDLGEDTEALDLGEQGPKSGPLSGVDPLAEQIESGVRLNEGASAKGKKKPVLTEDEAADLLAADDDVPAKPARKAAKAAKSDEDDLFSDGGTDPEVKAAAALMKDDDDKPTSGETEATAEAEDEGEGELVGAGAGAKAPPVKKKIPRPKYGRRWLGGMFLATLLIGGGAAGIWYAKPELITDLVKQSPNYQAPPAAPKPPPTPMSQLARAEIEKGDFDSAIDMLKDVDDADATALAARGEARWLKYLKEQSDKKASLSKDDPAVKQALADLSKAKNNLLATQIVSTTDFGLAANYAQEAGKTVASLHDILVKANLADPKADPKQLPAALSGAIQTKIDVEKRLDDIGKALVAGKIIADADKVDATIIGKLAKDFEAGKAALAAVNKVLEKADIKVAGDKGVEALLSAKKDFEGKLDAVNKLLADVKVKPGSTGVQDLIAARNKLAADRDDLDKTIKAAFKELADAKLIAPTADPRATLLEATKTARQKAESPLAIPLTYLGGTLGGLGTGVGKVLDRAFDNAALTAELSFYRLREPLIHSSDKKMDTYISLFQNGARKDAAQLAAAAKETAWLLSKDAKATPEARAKAMYVNGLAARNQEKFAEARKHLEDAVKLGQTIKDAEWTKDAEQALKEISDPSVQVLPAAERLAAAGNLKGAEEALTAGLKAMPNEPRLLAQRSLIRLERARGEAKVPMDLAKQIRDDAQAAAKDPKAAASASFSLGALEEELGNLEKAEAHYRQALKSHQGNADDAARYLIALARLLQRERAAGITPQPAPPPRKVQPKKVDPKKTEPEKKEPEKKEPEKKEPEKKSDEVSMEQMRELLILALVGVQPANPLPGEEEENPVAAARIKESIDLAKQLIESDNPKVKGQGYMILGQAIAKQGKRTEGLQHYVRGLELLFPGTQSKEMTKLLGEHPAFQQLDTLSTPNAVIAEQFFGKGLHLYWTKQYEKAEEEFKQAAHYFGQDARYQYYLGLAQLGQKNTLKRDAAYYSFEKGARLETANRPTTAEINLSLERLQGELRQFLNTFRQKALTASK